MQKKQQHGFTLIELMITVAIVAILSAVAFPAYTSHLVKGKRSAAQSFMMTVSNKEEAYMLNARSYFSAATQAQWAAVNVTVPQEVAMNYDLSVAATNTAGAPPSYIITATPKDAQAAKDTKCGTITYTSTGTKGKSGTAGTVTECWQ
jgi:type IV pilus assembly protein PilE